MLLLLQILLGSEFWEDESACANEDDSFRAYAIQVKVLFEQALFFLAFSHFRIITMLPLMSIFVQV